MSLEYNSVVCVFTHSVKSSSGPVYFRSKLNHIKKEDGL